MASARTSEAVCTIEPPGSAGVAFFRGGRFGEECHSISGRGRGPRSSLDFPTGIAVARLASGRETLALVERGLASILDHDERESERAVELVSALLQELHVWGGIGADLMANARLSIKPGAHAA